MRQRERGNAMLWSLGTIAAESWHGLPCSPLSFTNWQNFLLVMLAPLKTHCRSKPACQSTGSSDAVALQPAWPSCLKNAGYSVLTAGRCTQPGQQAPDSMRQRISPLLSWASLTSPCFAVSNDQQKGDRPQLWTRSFSSCTRIARANCLGRKLFLQFILYFRISGLFVSEEYLLLV